jgi:uncharacterized protein with FMN-binding domain
MRRALLAVISTIAGLVLLLGFKSHSPSAVTTPPAAIGTPSTSGSSGPTGPTTSTSGTRSVTGDAFDTRFGPVQVRVTLNGTKLTDVTILQAPAGTPRDVEINNYALPVLTQEALSANSAQIDMVSGATFTSEGYVQSLQSALDRAGG